MDKGLLQKDVAEMIGISEDSVTYWENGRSVPQVKSYPAIIAFLGYYPFDHDTRTIAGKLQQLINYNGWNHALCSKALGINARTVAKVLEQKRTVTAKIVSILEQWAQLPEHIKQQHRPD